MPVRKAAGEGALRLQKIDADLTRAAQGFDRRISVGLVVERRHRRAAETAETSSPPSLRRCILLPPQPRPIRILRSMIAA